MIDPRKCWQGVDRLAKMGRGDEARALAALLTIEAVSRIVEEQAERAGVVGGLRLAEASAMATLGNDPTSCPEGGHCSHYKGQRGCDGFAPGSNGCAWQVT